MGRLCELGPQLEYKAIVLSRPEPVHLAADKRVFVGTEMNISVERHPYLGATIETQEFTRNYVDKKVGQWPSGVHLLARIAESQPQAAYCVLILGLSSRWRFVARTIPVVFDFSFQFLKYHKCPFRSPGVYFL